MVHDDMVVGPRSVCTNDESESCEPSQVSKSAYATRSQVIERSSAGDW